MDEKELIEYGLMHGVNIKKDIAFYRHSSVDDVFFNRYAGHFIQCFGFEAFYEIIKNNHVLPSNLLFFDEIFRLLLDTKPSLKEGYLKLSSDRLMYRNLKESSTDVFMLEIKETGECFELGTYVFKKSKINALPVEQLFSVLPETLLIMGSYHLFKHISKEAVTFKGALYNLNEHVAKSRD